MTERKSNVFSMRLLRMVPAARGPIVANVALQWVALAANVALMILFGLFVQAWFEGVLDVGPWLWGLGCAAAVAIAVRMACLAGAQRCGLAAAQAAKRAVRQEVYDKLVRPGPSYREHASTGEAVQISVEGGEIRLTKFQPACLFCGYFHMFHIFSTFTSNNRPLSLAYAGRTARSNLPSPDS